MDHRYGKASVPGGAGTLMLTWRIAGLEGARRPFYRLTEVLGRQVWPGLVRFVYERSIFASVFGHSYRLLVFLQWVSGVWSGL